MTTTQFQQIPKEQLRDIHSMQSELTRRMLLAKDDLYKDVIRAVINREPELEDFKEVTIRTHPDSPGQELISYKGQPLGRITLSFEHGCEGSRCVFLFEPIPTFKQDGTN